ncbi:MAG: hypothetical protein ACQEXJ_12615 [Myxococcota bacterium]
MVSEEPTEARAAPAPQAVLARLDDLTSHQEALQGLRAQRPESEDERDTTWADAEAVEADSRAAAAWLAWAVSALPVDAWRRVAEDVEARQDDLGAGRAPLAALDAVWAAFDARGDGASGPLAPRALAFHTGTVDAPLLACVERRFGPRHPEITAFLAARLGRDRVELVGDGGRGVVQRLLAQPGRLRELLAATAPPRRPSLLAAAVRFLDQAARPGGLPVVGDPEPIRGEVLDAIAGVLVAEGGRAISLVRAPRDDHPLGAWLADLAGRPAPSAPDAARAMGGLCRYASRHDARVEPLLAACERALRGEATPSEQAWPAALGILGLHPDPGVARRAARLGRRALEAPDGPACAPAALGLADVPPAGGDEASVDLPASLDALAAADGPDVVRAATRVIVARRDDPGRLERLERTGRDVAARVIRGDGPVRPLLDAWEDVVDALGEEGEAGRDALVRLRMTLAEAPDIPALVYLDRTARDAGLASPGAALEPPPPGTGRGGAWAELRAAARDLERVARQATPGVAVAPRAWRAAHRRVEVLGGLDGVPGPARVLARLLARTWAPPPSEPTGADFDLLSAAWEEAPVYDVAALDSPDPWLADCHRAGLEARLSALAWLRGGASLEESGVGARRVLGVARDLLDGLAAALVPPSATPEARSPGAQRVLVGTLRRLLEDHPDLAARVVVTPDEPIPLRLAEPLGGVLTHLATGAPEDPADAARLADALLEGGLIPSPTPAGGRLEATVRMADHLLAVGARPAVLEALEAGARHPETRRIAALWRPAAEDRPVVGDEVAGILAVFPEADGAVPGWSDYLEERREAWRWVDFLLSAPALDPMADVGAVREAFGPGSPPAAIESLARRLDSALEAARAQVPSARRAGALRILALERTTDGARTPALRPGLRPPARSGPSGDPHAVLADLHETCARVLRLAREAGWTDLHLLWEGLVRSEPIRGLGARPPVTDRRVLATAPLRDLLQPISDLEEAGRALRRAAMPLLAALGAVGASWEAHLTALADDLAGFGLRMRRTPGDEEAPDDVDPTVLLRRRLAFGRLVRVGAWADAVAVAPETAGGERAARRLRWLHRASVRVALVAASWAAWLGVTLGLGGGPASEAVRCVPVGAALGVAAPIVASGLALPVALWLASRRRRRRAVVAFAESGRLATPRWWAVHALLTLGVVALVPGDLLGLALGVLTGLGGLLVLSARLEPADTGPIGPDRAAAGHWLLALQHATTLAAAGLVVYGLYAPAGCGGDFVARPWALVGWPLAAAGVACLLRAARPSPSQGAPEPPMSPGASPGGP